MPVEVHRSRPYYIASEHRPKNEDEFDPFAPEVPAVSFTKREKEPLTTPVKFRFQHDLESLWWVTLWILLYRVGGDAALKLEEKIYTYSNIPSDERVGFFESRGDNLTGHIREELNPLVSTILDIRGIIGDSYQDKEKSENFKNHKSYHDIYKGVWISFGILVQGVMGIKDVDFQKLAPSTKPRGEAPNKRLRSPSRSTGATTKKSKPNDDEDYMPKKVIPRKHFKK